MSEAWINVMTSNNWGGDSRLGVKYSEAINKIVVTVGEARLFLDADATEQLLTDLGERLIEAKVAWSVKSGEGVWVTPTTFLSPEEAKHLRSEWGAA